MLSPRRLNTCSLSEYLQCRILLNMSGQVFQNVMGVKLYIYYVLFLLILFSFMPVNNFAHNVNIFAWVEGKQVHTESYYPDGKMVSGGEIEVYNSKGKLIIKGKTDEQGRFSFEVQKPEEIVIVLNAGMGHRAQITLKEQALESEGLKSDEKKGKEVQKEKENGSLSEPSELKEDKGKKTPPEIGDMEKALVLDLTEDRIRQIVREEVSKEVAPLARSIALLHEKKPGLTEILGGIGYIIGLMGIILYFKSKKASSK